MASAGDQARQDAVKAATAEALRNASGGTSADRCCRSSRGRCCLIAGRGSRVQGRHAGRAADHRERRWPDVVRDRRVVAARHGRLFPKPIRQTTQFPQLTTPGVNLRRGRLYFVAKYDDFRVNVTPDFGNNPDGI